MENSTFNRLAKIAAGCAALIVCAVSWTVWVGPIPVVSDRVDRVAYSLGLGVGCGSATVKQTVIELIEERSLGTTRSAGMTIDIPSVANSGSRGDVQECRGMLTIKFSSQIAEQLSAAIQNDDVLQEQVRHVWDANKREASLPIDYEITRDTTFMTGRSLFGLLPLKELVQLANEYEKSNAKVASASQSAFSDQSASPGITNGTEIPVTTTTEQLQAAFTAVYGSDTQLKVGDATINFVSARLVQLDGSKYALLAEGTNEDDCHACNGFLRITYLDLNGDTFSPKDPEIARDILGAQFGAPPEWKLIQAAGGVVLISQENFYMQGGDASCSVGAYRLTPDGIVEDIGLANEAAAKDPICKAKSGR